MYCKVVQSDTWCHNPIQSNAEIVIWMNAWKKDSRHALVMSSVNTTCWSSVDNYQNDAAADDDHDGNEDDDDDHDGDEDDNETSLEHPGGFSQLITLGAVSVSQHNGFGANEPKQTATKLTSAGQTSARPNLPLCAFETQMRHAPCSVCGVRHCARQCVWLGGAN